MNAGLTGSVKQLKKAFVELLEVGDGKAGVVSEQVDKLAAALVPEKVMPTEAELKAARDAKYAARKQRKK